MTNPVFIALRLRAFLLTGLVLWLLALPHAGVATPRATVVRATGPRVEHQALLSASEALSFVLLSASDCGPARLGLPGAALLPAGAEFVLCGSRPGKSGCIRETPLLPELPALRVRLRASVSPNAP